MKTLCILLIISTVAFQGSIAQTTITLQPDASLGKDATIWDYSPNLNDGSDIYLHANAWTWSGNQRIARGLIEFDLSSIPASATVVDARLSLYYNPNPTVVGHSDRSGSNEWLIQRITGSWDEAMVTWNNQPQITTQGQMIMPGCTGCDTPVWGTADFPNIDATAFVQYWVSNPSDNFGLMIRLQTEQYFRVMKFASSDEPNSSLHPKLVVTYYTDTCSVTIVDTTFITVYDTNTVNVYDTTVVTVYDTVAVTDTLIIDIPTGLTPPNDINTIKIYPNPTTSLIYIDNGNYSLLSDHTLKIVDALGRQVFSSYINVPGFTVDFSQFGTTGLFFVQIINPNNQIVTEKKIILQ